MKFFAKKTVLLLILLMIVSPVIAHAKELELGMSFSTARKVLIQQGWRPIKVHKKFFPYPEMGKKFREMRVIEVESCAMDKPGCIFNYKKGDTYLHLFTQGEEIKDMRVSYWQLDCTTKDFKSQKHAQSEVHAGKQEIGMPILDRGASFLHVRKLLIHKGWQPTNVHKGNNYKYDDMTKKLINADITEIESCTMGKPGCIFNYKEDDVCLRLFTEGKNINDMRVHYWTFDCPDGDK